MGGKPGKPPSTPHHCPKQSKGKCRKNVYTPKWKKPYCPAHKTYHCPKEYTFLQTEKCPGCGWRVGDPEVVEKTDDKKTDGNGDGSGDGKLADIKEEEKPLRIISRSGKK